MPCDVTFPVISAPQVLHIVLAGGGSTTTGGGDADGGGFGSGSGTAGCVGVVGLVCSGFALGV